MNNNWYIPKDRFILIVIALLLIWLGFFVFFYLKADEVTKNPCQICAKKIGNNVICTSYFDDRTLVFYPNYSIEDDRSYILP